VLLCRTLGVLGLFFGVGFLPCRVGSARLRRLRGTLGLLLRSGLRRAAGANAWERMRCRCRMRRRCRGVARTRNRCRGLLRPLRRLPLPLQQSGLTRTAIALGLRRVGPGGACCGLVGLHPAQFLFGGAQTFTPGDGLQFGIDGGECGALVSLHGVQTIVDQEPLQTRLALLLRLRLNGGALGVQLGLSCRILLRPRGKRGRGAQGAGGKDAAHGFAELARLHTKLASPWRRPSRKYSALCISFSLDTVRVNS